MSFMTLKPSRMLEEEGQAGLFGGVRGQLGLAMAKNTPNPINLVVGYMHSWKQRTGQDEQLGEMSLLDIGGEVFNHLWLFDRRDALYWTYGAFAAMCRVSSAQERNSRWGIAARVGLGYSYRPKDKAPVAVRLYLQDGRYMSQQPTEAAFKPAEALEVGLCVERASSRGVGVRILVN